MTTIRNFTPHTINLDNGDAFQSEGVARVSTTHAVDGEITTRTCTGGVDHHDHETFCGCENWGNGNVAPLFSVEFGAIVGLPDPKKGVAIIVSAIVLDAAKKQGRTDCIAPATNHPNTIRNERGHIVSVPGFIK